MHNKFVMLIDLQATTVENATVPAGKNIRGFINIPTIFAQNFSKTKKECN